MVPLSTYPFLLVVLFLLSCPLHLPLLDLKWMLIAGKVIKGSFLLLWCSMPNIFFIPLLLPCPRRHHFQCRSKGAFFSCPLTERCCAVGSVSSSQLYWMHWNYSFWYFIYEAWSFNEKHGLECFVCSSPSYLSPNVSIVDFWRVCACQNPFQICSLFCKTWVQFCMISVHKSLCLSQNPFTHVWFWGWEMASGAKALVSHCSMQSEWPSISLLS